MLYQVSPKKNSIITLFLDERHSIYFYMICVVSVVLLLSFCEASRTDPGYLKTEIPFMEVLNKAHYLDVCPDCQVIRTDRSKHCAICNKCVDRFDHHCPWLNNCVGIRNHNPYLVFIISLLLVLLLIIASFIEMLVNECNPKLN